jgi:hypothetical protein
MMKSMCIRAVLQWQFAFLRFLSRYPWVVHARLMQSLDLGLLWRSKSFVLRSLSAIFFALTLFWWEWFIDLGGQVSFMGDNGLRNITLIKSNFSSAVLIYMFVTQCTSPVRGDHFYSLTFQSMQQLICSRL